MRVVPYTHMRVAVYNICVWYHVWYHTRVYMCVYVAPCIHTRVVPCMHSALMLHDTVHGVNCVLYSVGVQLCATLHYCALVADYKVWHAIAILLL